jgi:hypothetical protein
MKFLRKAVFLDTTVVQAGTFEEALKKFKDEDYQYPGKPEEVQYFQEEEKVACSCDYASNWYIHPVNNKEQVIMYAMDYATADSLRININRNSSVRLNNG